LITSVEGGKLIEIRWVWGRRHSMGGEDERFLFIKLETGVAMETWRFAKRYEISLG